MAALLSVELESCSDKNSLQGAPMLRNDRNDAPPRFLFDATLELVTVRAVMIKSDQSYTPRSRSRRITPDWTGSALTRESTLHQLSPYIGKIKSTIAASLIKTYSQAGELVYDPFSGSGTVALEGWLAGRRVLANDLSPYAWTLTQGKLSPYTSLQTALSDLETVSQRVELLTPSIDLRAVPTAPFEGSCK